MVEFKCAQCGHCCKTIRGPMVGQVHGLMILPEERSLFPRKLVKPMFRYMTSYNPLPGFVWMYQVDSEVCPHYDNGCKIYNKRPTTCRAFPFEPKGRGLAIHGSCPEIQKLIEAGDSAPDIKPSATEMEGVIKTKKYYNEWMRTHEVERFDVELKEWRYIIDGVTQQHMKDMGWI